MPQPDAAVSRRQTLGMLLAGLGAVGLGACKDDAAGTPSAGDGAGSGGPPSPELDAERLTDALNGILDQSPWAGRYPDAVSGAVAQLEALREAGLEASADATTYALNGVVANVAAALGLALTEAEATPDGAVPDFGTLTSDMMAEMEAAAAGMRGELPAAAAELTEALGGDTVPANPEMAAEVATLEAEVRAEMHEAGVSGQSLMNALVRSMQVSRVTVGLEGSVAAAEVELNRALQGLASDDDVADWAAGLTRHLPRTMPRARSGAPPPDGTDDACGVIGWVAFFIDWSKAVHSGLSSAAARANTFVEELDGSYEYLQDAWSRWLAEEFTDAMAEETKTQVTNAIAGEAVTLSEQECYRVAAFLLVVLWFVDLILTLIAFAQAITWASAGLGAFPATSAIVFLFILLQLIILWFTLQMVCGVVGILPAVRTMLGGCQ